TSPVVSWRSGLKQRAQRRSQCREMQERGLMRLSGWQSLAVSSLLLSALATAELRPQYGRTLHVATRIAFSPPDPADDSQPDTVARRNLTRLMFDTLVTMD